MFSKKKKKKEFESPFVNHRKGLNHDQAVLATIAAGAVMMLVYFVVLFAYNSDKNILLTGPISDFLFIYFIPPVILAFGTISLYKYFRAR